jgi:predicted AlkP superfamily phosphohydrolase/phosphomutase
MNATRVLVLGIDAASPELLKRWALEGSLPNIARLLKQGRSGTLRGLDGFFIGSTWPSIYTGASPATHGFHYLQQLKPGTYEFYQPADHGLFSGDPFWRVISRAGYRVAILDAPLSAPETDLNGIQLLEWGCHDSVYGFGSHPESLGRDLVSRYGMHPIGASCDATRRSAADYIDFVDALVRGVEHKTQMTRELLNQGGWDLFMQVFSEAHCVGHQCWHLHDPNHPAHDPQSLVDVADPLQRVYQAIDGGVGEILSDAGDCPVVLFTSHGMAHWYGLQSLLPDILVRLGVSQPESTTDHAAAAESRFVAAATWLWHHLPRSLRLRLAGARELLGPKTTPNDQAGIGVDPTRSRCFHHRHGLAVAGIRLNVAGREPDGILRAGQEVDEFCRSLSADLLDIIDERSGEPFVKNVLRVKELYEGPRLADLPDLVVEFNDATPTGSTAVGEGQGATIRISSPKIGVLEGRNHYGRTGEHRRDGLLLVAGPDMEPGTFTGPISVLDLAPTWAAMFGQTLPMAEGSAIEELSSILPSAR